MTPLDGLKEARRLVEAGWTQGVAARDHEGQPVAPQSSTAVCFCVLGAISRVTRSSVSMFNIILKTFDAVVPGDGWATEKWNDAPGRTQTEVLDAFDRAIALAEADAGQEGGK